MADKRKKGKTILDIFKGIIVRLLFILHASSSLILLYNNNNLDVMHISFLIPLLFLLIEGVVTIFCYRGEEMKYVWPCGFFYIATVTPVIWVLELGVLRSKSEIEAKILNDPKHRGRIGHFRGIESKLVADLLNLDGRKFCEIGLIICLITGRWLSPRSSLSRQTLSAMLLSYVANAADILDLFTSLQAPELVNHKDVTYGILTVYTWSLLQFALVATVAYKKRTRKRRNKENNDLDGNSLDSKSKKKKSKNENDAAVKEKSIEEKMRKKRNREKDEFLDKRSFDTRSIGTVSIMTDNGVKKSKLQRIAPEIPQLLIGLLMQDGPFLLLRFVLCLEYGVYDELHVFFMLKNTVVSTLLLYRLVLVARDYSRSSGAGDNANSCGVSEYTIGTSDTESMFDPYRVTSYI